MTTVAGVTGRLSAAAAAGSGTAAAAIDADAAELARATVDELARVSRAALAGRDGWTSQLPPVRTSRAGRAARRRAGRGPTRRAWRTTTRRQSAVAGGKVMIVEPRAGNPASHLAAILEHSPEIRGRRNVWHRAALRTIEHQAVPLAAEALRRAPDRVRTNKIRRVKAQEAAAARNSA